MSVWDLIPVLLLALLGLASFGGAIIVVLAIRLSRYGCRVSIAPAFNPHPDLNEEAESNGVSPPHRPATWLAVRTHDVAAVQEALVLHDPVPCSWAEGIRREEKLFIAPPVKGWVLAAGSGLPDPKDDIDACFRFVLDLSRKLGQVHYFRTDSALHHHAWVRCEAGRVLRAYAWAGSTLWNQGVKTTDEIKLGMKCFGYADTPDQDSWNLVDLMSANADKVPLLAARWSLDPGGIDERLLENARGVVGEPRHFA